MATAFPEPGVTTEQSAPDLVRSHLALVQQVLFQVAGHFPSHADRRELAQAAALGLVEAASRYDSSRGVPFERWAALRIRGAILDAVRAIDFAPRSVRAAARRIEDARNALAGELGRTPTRPELARRVGMTAAELAGTEGRVHRSLVLSLDAAVADDDEVGTFADAVAIVGDPDPAEVIERRELGAYLATAVELLPERVRAVVVGYFVDGRSSSDLAAELGVTESRVSQLRTEGLAMLRSGIEAQYRQYDAPVSRPSRGHAAAARDAAYAAAIAAGAAYRSRRARHAVGDLSRHPAA